MAMLPDQALQATGRDWLDYLSVWSGLLGALLAGLAIAYAAWQAAQSKKDLIRERRLEFELNLLAQIRRQMSETQFQHLNGYVSALIKDQTNETELALLRVMVGAKSGPLGRAKVDRLRDELKKSGEDVAKGMLRAAGTEVDDAIERRVTE